MNDIKIEKRWLQYFHDVANIRLSIELIRDDIEFERDGGRIIYAIDTNIIFLYAEPLQHKEHAITFKDEDEKVQQASAISLADFIFFNGLLSKKDNYLLLPASLEEEYIDCCCRIYDHSINDLLEINNKDIIDNIESLIEKINKNPINENLKNELIQYLLVKCQDLVRYLGDGVDSTAKSAIDRLAKLDEFQRVLSLDKNAPLDYIPDIAEVEELADKWYQKLKQIKIQLQKSFYSRLVRCDVKALAQIVLINSFLYEEKAKIRLYYISADEAIHELVKSVEFKKVLKESKKKFSANFVRHPAQYVNCLRFTSDATLEEKLDMLDKIQKPIDEFLKIFSNTVDHIGGKESQYLKNLRKIVDENPSTGEQLIGNKVIEAFGSIDPTLAKYKALKEQRMELLTLRSMSKALDINEAAEGLTQKLRDIGIRDLLDNRRKETYEKVSKISLTFGVIGFTAEYSDYIRKNNIVNDQNTQPRGPVSLKRRADKKGQEAFFEKIHRLVFRKRWSDLFDLIENETPYIKNLIYALLAADAGHWHQARNCCKDALNAAENKTIINEGLYFLAVALRHDCLSYVDYLDAISVREQGLEIWKNRNEGRDDLRFEMERLALATAFFNYKHFMNWRTVEHEPEIRKTWDDLLKLAEKIEKESDESSIIRSRIKRQVYSNLCCLFIFDERISFIKNISKDEGQNAYIELDKLSKEKDFRTSYFINFLLAYLNWHFASNTSERRDSWQDAYRKTKDAYHVYTIPYEAAKYSHYMKYLENHQYN